MELRIRLREGPVVLKSLGGRGAFTEIHLWDGIVGREHFPRGTDTAYYQLELAKEVLDPNCVAGIDEELQEALRQLSRAWHFGGGAMLLLDEREVSTRVRHSTNAEEVEEVLLAEAGLKKVSQRATSPYESLAGYRHLPLGPAIEICAAARADPLLGGLLDSYYRARTDDTAWYVHLYKVRERLEQIHHGSRPARQAVSASKRDWESFGRKVNELRHAQPPGAEPRVLRSDIRELRGLARDWVCRELIIRGLAVF